MTYALQTKKSMQLAEKEHGENRNMLEDRFFEEKVSRQVG